MKKYKLTTNLGLKIIAFIFAAFLWLIVVNLDKPVSVDTYTEVPVTILNDDIITSAGDVYQVVGDQTVNVLVYANREVQDHLTKEDIVATADIKEMDTSTGLVPIKVDIPNYAGKYESAEASPKNLQIQREKSGKKVLSLAVSTDGTKPRDGYMLGDMSVNPEKITITGAESVLDEIDRAVARINVDDLYEDSEEPADLILFDKSGNAMNQSQLETNLEEEGITVSVEILKIKSVPVKFNVSGTPASGYRYTGCYSEPETVQICGKGKEVDKVESIDVPASALNISGASEKIEKAVDITPYLPEEVGLVEENAAKVTVTIMIEEEGTRTINVLVSSVKINGLAEGLKVTYEPDAEISLRFNGDEQKLEILDISNGVSVDLSQYTEPGTYKVPVNVVVPEGIVLAEKVTVSLTISEKQMSEDEGDAQNSSEAAGEQDGK